MMKNLGKILFIFLLLPQAIFANVIASVDRENVGFGEVVSYNLSLSGDDVKRPEIFTLCGEDIVSTGTATSIQIINGTYQKSYVLSYKFVPTASCTIEPLSIEVGGKMHTTQAIDIVVEKFVASKDDDFSLSLRTNKEEVYVGESFEVTLLFRQKRSAEVVDNKFSQPEFKGFWLKGEAKQEVIEGPEYSTTKVVYKIAAQREGNLHILPAKIGIASRQNVKNYFGGLFPEVQWKTYFSNDLNISVKALPHDVSLVGDFSIEAFVDKTQVHPNEAVNLTLKIRGNGNLEDIKTFKPYIDGVSIFDEKILIKDDTLSQKITFVGERDFTIAAFSLKSFNPKTQAITTHTTKDIAIKMRGAKRAQKEELVMKKEEKPHVDVVQEHVQTKKLSTLWIVVVFLGGFILGVGSMLLKPFLIFKKSTRLNLKDHKMLLIKLMPFKDNKDVKELIDLIESKLYKDTKQEIDKKHIKEIIGKYEII